MKNDEIQEGNIYISNIFDLIYVVLKIGNNNIISGITFNYSKSGSSYWEWTQSEDSLRRSFENSYKIE